MRAAMHIKGTYTLEELRKPFVVAYLEPFPFSRTQKCSKILNESQPFFFILSHATAEAARRASKAS
ncbi:MAG: hypothetical protein LUC06_04385, partial [Oscillospiraceae bacterium]|nr:hypothetical protein [Oscillospiraceae bacterium]